MDFEQFSMKELYDVALKSTYNMKIGNRDIEPMETIAQFDKITISNFKELRSYITAHGGYLDEDRVIWDDVREMRFDFSQGVFSKEQFALMTNSHIIEKQAEKPLPINKREYVETNEDAQFTLQEKPYAALYIYDKETGIKLKKTDYTWDGNKTITILGITGLDNAQMVYRDFVVDYAFEYMEKATFMLAGKELVKGFLYLEGKTRIKDDKTGQEKTGLIIIPKLKLMSDLSIRLGAGANPQVGYFNAVGVPVGDRGEKKVMELIFLDDDIDSDM